MLVYIQLSKAKSENFTRSGKKTSKIPIVFSYFLKLFEQNSFLVCIYLPKVHNSVLQLLVNTFIYLKINILTITSTVDDRFCTCNSVVLVQLIYFLEKNQPCCIVVTTFVLSYT